MRNVIRSRILGNGDGVYAVVGTFNFVFMTLRAVSDRKTNGLRP